MKILKLAELSMEECIEVRTRMIKDMIKMQKSKRWRRKLSDLCDFTERLGKHNNVLNSISLNVCRMNIYSLQCAMANYQARGSNLPICHLNKHQT